jgi:hypothetical protein
MEDMCYEIRRAEPLALLPTGLWIDNTKLCVCVGGEYHRISKALGFTRSRYREIFEFFFDPNLFLSWGTHLERGPWEFVHNLL